MDANSELVQLKAHAQVISAELAGLRDTVQLQAREITRWKERARRAEEIQDQFSAWAKLGIDQWADRQAPVIVSPEGMDALVQVQTAAVLAKDLRESGQ